jgi:eukaryotic-like serine/threonine-protein kinase
MPAVGSGEHEEGRGAKPSAGSPRPTSTGMRSPGPRIRVSEYIIGGQEPELPALLEESGFDQDDEDPTIVGHLFAEPSGASPSEAKLPLRARPSYGDETVPAPIARGREASGPVIPPPPRHSASVSRPPIPRAASDDPLAEGGVVGGRYRTVRRIGEGGMGKVFEVTHEHLGKTFALKIIHQNFAGQTKVRDLFYREARLASALSHPNIVSVVDFGEDPRIGAFMVMEFLEGRRLNEVLHKERRLSVRPTCEIMLQVAEALHYIHARNVVHCDIKTENILLCEQPGSKRRKQVVKLLDFGLARSTATRNTTSLSGTPHYVAPERIRGREAGPSSDIYGLGILFYELLTGRVPWDGEVAYILAGHLEQKPQPPSEIIPDGIDPALEQLILRALEKEPDHRHKDMAAFIYELNTVMDMLGFGRRNRRVGSRQKILVERSTENRRDELVRTVFDSMRLPMALIDTQGRIVVANSAFAKFVMGVATEVEGLAARSTPLTKVWKNFEADLARALGGAHLRRVVELDGAKGETWRLLMWLDPGTGNDHVIFGVHPLDP